MILIYPNLRTLRKVYSEYLTIKIQKNRIVVILPYYETVESVKKNLRMVTDSKQNDFPKVMMELNLKVVFLFLVLMIL